MTRFLILNVAHLISCLSELLHLLVNQLDAEEVFVVLHDLKIAILIVHVETVLAVLDEVRQLVAGDLEEV